MAVATKVMLATDSKPEHKVRLHISGDQELCFHCPAQQQSSGDTDAAKFGKSICTPRPGIFWFPASSDCPAFKSRTANHLHAPAKKRSRKQVRLKIYCNKISLLSQVQKMSGAGTLKYSCSHNSLKIPDVLVFCTIVYRANANHSYLSDAEWTAQYCSQRNTTSFLDFYGVF